MKSRGCRGIERIVFAWLIVMFAATSGELFAASRYDPRLRFRTITTPRFDIHFHQGEEADARRLARIAEEVATTLDRTLGPASGRVHVVLVNQSDLSNGWATPVPYNLIEISAAGPGGESLIGNVDDWVRLVFTHEYTHIVHLGRSAGWIGGLRRAFGRNPALFPNLALPLWAIEGIATFEESAQTGYGRVNAGDFRQIVTLAAASSRFEPIDRVGGGLDDWPGGNAQYAYGALFHRFLADRYGTDTLRRLTDETGRRIPYFGAPAFRSVFGRSLGSLWSEFGEEMRLREQADPVTATRVTHHGFIVTGPRFARDGRIYYSTINPHGFPSLMSIEPGSEPQRVARRYLGEQVAFAGSLVVFDEMEVTAEVSLQSDLYALAPGSGQRTRLTRGMRAADPDVSVDGRTIVFTVQRGDRRDLAMAELKNTPAPSLSLPTVLASAPDTEFESPHWTPDGRRIAVERHVRGSLPQIVIVDVETRAVTIAAGVKGARCVSPVWMPDGRRLVFASDRDGGPFRLFVLDLGTGTSSRLEGTGPSAQSPDVSPDGRTLVFVGYTTDGYDLFTLPLESARLSRVENPSVLPATEAAATSAGATDRNYRPWSTLAPRFWTPTVESDGGEVVAGASAGGADALARHAYVATVQWASSRARPDWDVSYVYDRWRLALFANAADDTDPFQTGKARSVEVNAGVLFPWKRVRWTQSILGAFHGATDTIVCSTCDRPIDERAERRSIRTGYAFTSAKRYGYSISTEEGWSLTATNELIARGLGSDGNAGSIVTDARGYRRLGGRHNVLAARLASAHSWGDEMVRRQFTDGGSGPQTGGFAFSDDAIGLVRGFDEQSRGWHAVVANLDYRLPLVRIERGWGTLPAFVRAVHGAVFADAGHTWSESFGMREARVSFGIELSADTVLGYSLPITFTAGAAWRHDGLSDRNSGAIFGRIDRAF
jgi:dipeptidyl aminopeptidase/acylaminoacyl peptidase